MGFGHTFSPDKTLGSEVHDRSDTAFTAHLKRVAFYIMSFKSCFLDSIKLHPRTTVVGHTISYDQSYYTEKKNNFHDTWLADVSFETLILP